MNKIIIILIIILILFVLNIKTKENFYKETRFIDLVNIYFGKDKVSSTFPIFGNPQDKKINIYLFYNSNDINSVDYKEDGIIYKFLEKYKIVYPEIFTFKGVNCNSKLEKCFFDELLNIDNEQHKDFIEKHLTINNILDKVPKIILFFNKYSKCITYQDNEVENYIVEYNGAYNLDLNNNLKNVKKDIENFIDNTIEKYLFYKKDKNITHKFDIRFNDFYKCELCTKFIENYITPCESSQNTNYNILGIPNCL